MQAKFTASSYDQMLGMKKKKKNQVNIESDSGETEWEVCAEKLFISQSHVQLSERHLHDPAIVYTHTFMVILAWKIR